MKRLIDTNELLEHIKILGIWDETENQDIFTDNIKNVIIRKIDAIPTAYDQDKVVKQLKEEFTKFYGKNWDKVPYLVKAIEIVENGGV